MSDGSISVCMKVCPHSGHVTTHFGIWCTRLLLRVRCLRSQEGRQAGTRFLIANQNGFDTNVSTAPPRPVWTL
jgi:hypothetical protein